MQSCLLLCVRENRLSPSIGTLCVYVCFALTLEQQLLTHAGGDSPNRICVVAKESSANVRR